MASAVTTPKILQEHLDNRPSDAQIGFLPFDLEILRALARGDDLGEDSLPCGDYLPAVLAHAGWWMMLADLAVGYPCPPSHQRQLIGLRSVLGEVLAAVPLAWGETAVHAAGQQTSTSAGRVLLSRYLRLRTKVFALLSTVLPGVELDPFADLP